MTTIRKIIKYPVYKIFTFLNFLRRKKNNCIYFIPHENCLTDGYDVINFRSDNVLSILNYMLKQEKFAGFNFYVETYDFSRQEEYKRYCDAINNKINVFFIKNGLSDKHLQLNNFRIFIKCKYCFTAQHLYDLSYKSPKQKIMCLGYFTPFKNDYQVHADVPRKNVSLLDRVFDVYITTSKLASRIISIDSGISYYKFNSLGFSRNDHFFNDFDKSHLMKNINSVFNGSVNKIILYTPTFRNYEYQKELPSRNIFGYSDADMTSLNNLLEKHDAIIIAKLHPYMSNSLIKKDVPSRILMSQTIDNFSLYEYMTISDGLITDYTSTYFDYLLLDKPVIFNFYDKEKYEKDRGFSFEPIEAFCAGEQVDSFMSLMREIDAILSGKDNHQPERLYVNNLMNKYQDGNSSQRILEHVLKM